MDLASPPQCTLEDAQAILAGGHSSDEDLLRPEGEAVRVDEVERMRRSFASGSGTGGGSVLSAWGILPLQPAEEDLKRQKMYERVHRMTFRKRNAANDFGNPDEIEDLMLDMDRRALPPAAGSEGDEKLTGLVKGASGVPAAKGDGHQDGKNDDAPAANRGLEAYAAAVVGAGASSASGAEISGRGRGISPRVQTQKYLGPSAGTYLDLVLDKDRITAAATSALGADNTEAAAARAVRDAAPAHLHRFMTPLELELPAGSQVVKISGGREHALVLLQTSQHLQSILPQHQENEGRVLVMGAGNHGQLGLGDDRLQTVPVVLSTLNGGSGRNGGGGRVRAGGERMGGHGSEIRRVVDVAAGSKHSVVVSEECEVATFGTDVQGSTGQGETGEGKMHRLPRWMYWITTDTTRMVACAAGESHTVLLSASWHVFTVGDGTRGKLGHGNERSQLTPRRMEALMGLKIASVATGHNHTLLITETGLLYGCGANSHGQLGMGDRVDRLSPVRLRHADFVGGVAAAAADHEPERRTVDLQERILGPLPGIRGRFLPAAEEDRPFAQPTEQQLAAAVRVREEVLGIRRTHNDDEFRLRMGLSDAKKRGSKVVQVCGGRAHTVILTDVGRVYMCGHSNCGQLGQGHTRSLQAVTAVPTLVNLSCVQVAAGDDHSVMLTTLGHVYVCGANAVGQLGDGTLESCWAPMCVQPVVGRDDLLTKSKQQLEVLQAHPMFGVLAEQVFAAGASTFAVATGGERVFVCGSGAYGHPYDRNPTTFAGILRLKLDKREQKKTMVMGSTVRMLRPDEQGFQDLVRQMVLYSLYNEKALAHIIKATLDEVMRHPGFVTLYAKLLERCMHLCLECTVFAFRRVVLLAVEDRGVTLLQAQDEALRRRLLQRMGWARYQQQQREAGGVGGAGQMTYFGAVTDKESYNDFVLFREDCKSLQGFLRVLQVHDVLLEGDIRDLAAGMPGSQHSIGIVDSEQAQKKLTFFRSLARWRSPGERAADEAMHAATAAGRGVSGAGRKAAHNTNTKTAVVRQQGLTQDQPLPIRASEEAAWEFSGTTGWEAYSLPEDVVPEEGPGWGAYMDRQQREAAFRSPVAVLRDGAVVHAAVVERGLGQAREHL
jgi:alpha-tubulin suppressor-like RCC1 family protein